MGTKTRILRICVIAGIVGLVGFVGSALWQLRGHITEYLWPTNTRVSMLRQEASEQVLQAAEAEAPAEGTRALTAPKVPTVSIPVDAKLQNILERLDQERIQSLLAGIQDTALSVVKQVPKPSSEDIAVYKDVVRAFLKNQFFESLFEFALRGIGGFIIGVVLQLLPIRRR